MRGGLNRQKIFVQNMLHSILFVPANCPDRFEKALATAADIVLIDLEDAVGFADKDIAREALILYAKKGLQKRIAIRLNSPHTLVGLKDLIALQENNIQPEIIVLPKVESASTINLMTEILGNEAYMPKTLAMVETPKGIHLLRKMAQESRNLRGFALGAADFSNEMNILPTWEALQPYRAQIVSVCKEFGLISIDSPYFEIQNIEGLQQECNNLKMIGFDGKFAIHPTQIPVINATFYPTEAEITLAKIIVEAFEASHKGAIQVQGMMIDKPIYEKYKRKLKINP